MEYKKLYSENDEIMTIISSRLNKLMQENETSTRDIVLATGISTGLINMMRRGEGNPSIVNIMKIARFFGKPVSYLVELDSNDKNDEIIQVRVYDMYTNSFSPGNEEYILSLKRAFFPDIDFAIRITDDTLSPFFKKGNIFVISKKPLQNGDTALLNVENKNIIRKYQLINKEPVFSTIGLKSEFEKFSHFNIIGIIDGAISP